MSMARDHFGKYLLKRSIGRGRFGEVWEAIDSTRPDSDILALKIISTQGMDDNERRMLRQRFVREGEITRDRLNHPGIVKTIEYGEVDGDFYLAMLRAPGITLDKRIEIAKQLAWHESITMLRGLASALDYLHEHHLIHRDLKPKNIMVDEKGKITIIDLGLALDLKAPRLTLDGDTPGTLSYIAPERLTRGDTTPATDVYSMATILYEMLQGDVLFNAESYEQAFILHTRIGPRLPSRWPESVPAMLTVVMRAALDKDPSRRYASAGEFLKALEALARGQLLLPGGRRTPYTPQLQRAWITYTCVRQINQLACSHGVVWAATGGGVLSINTHNQSHNIMSGGLGTTDTRAIALDPSTNRLWAISNDAVIYKDAYLDRWLPAPLDPTIQPESIRSICAAPDGSLWFITANTAGVWKDQQPRLYSAGGSGTSLQSVVMGADRRPWFASLRGLLRLDGQTLIPASKDLPTGCTIVQLAEVLGQIWAATNRGVYRWDGQVWKTWTQAEGLLSNQVNAICAGERGDVWVATAAGLAVIQPGGDVVPYPSTPGDIKALVWNTSSQQLWTGSADGLGTFFGGQFTPLERDFGLGDQDVAAVFVDSSRNTWFGTGSGLTFYARHGHHQWKSYTRADGINSGVSVIAEWPNGCLWFGTRGSGLLRFQRGFGHEEDTWSEFNYTNGDLPHDHITALLVTRDGLLWIGTEQGLAVWDGNNFRCLPNPPGQYGCRIQAFAEDLLGAIHCATPSGAYAWNGKTWNEIGAGSYKELSQQPVYSVAVHPNDGAVLYATGRGAYKLAPNKALQRIYDPELLEKPVRCVFVDRAGGEWFGSGRGVVYFDGKTYRRYTTRDGLPGNIIKSIWEDPDGDLWLATETGVGRLTSSNKI